MYSNALYSPYGTYELKSKYQRNFGLGTAITLSFVLLILAVAWIILALPEEDFSDIRAVVIRTVADLGPPPSIAKKPPQVKVEQPQVVAPKVGIPKPVADDEVIDEDVMIATRDELAEIMAPDVTTLAGDGEITVDIEPKDYLPVPGEFVAVEIYPQLIYRHEPEYPRLARQAGITGEVKVWVFVNEEGNVIDVSLCKSSGTTSLDEAAIKAAYKCKFKPGIQNGRPLKIWVAYDFEFKLD